MFDTIDQPVSMAILTLLEDASADHSCLAVERGVSSTDGLSIVALAATHAQNYEFTKVKEVLSPNLDSLRNGEYYLIALALYADALYLAEDFDQLNAVYHELEEILSTSDRTSQLGIDFALLSLGWHKLLLGHQVYGRELLNQVIHCKASMPRNVYLAFRHSIRGVLMEQSGSTCPTDTYNFLRENRTPIAEMEELYEQMLSRQELKMFRIDVLNMRGLYFCFSTQWKRAIDDFSTIIQLPGVRESPMYLCALIEALYGRANAYAEEGKYDLAQKDYLMLQPLMDDFIPDLCRKWKVVKSVRRSEEGWITGRVRQFLMRLAGRIRRT